MKIGFIGIGNMGAGMTNNLLKAGHTLVVNDLRRDFAGPLIAAGAEWADTPRLVAAQTEIVLSCLPGPGDVETVVLGPDGLLEGMDTGAVYIDLSSNSPAKVRALHATLAGKGIQMLDAPVSGGVVGARNGRLVIMTGGERRTFERVKVVLEAIGDHVVYCGEIGTGSICKLVHNAISEISSQAITELFTLGVKAGVEPKSLWETTRRGAFGRMAGGVHTLPDTWFSGDFEPDREKGYFSTALMRKDMGLATDLGRELDVPLPMANLAEQVLVEAVLRGWSDDPCTKVRLLQEERAGVQVRGDFPSGVTTFVFEE